MKIEKYLTESKKTLSENSSIDDKKIRLLHGAIGLVTESGELMDAFKKSIYYGKKLDVVNVKEELGDIMWYFAIFLRELDIKFEDLLDINIEKLRSRYGEKFSEKKAFKRDLKAERKILARK